MTRMMRAMVLEGTGRPLRLTERPVPEPGPGQALLRVEACAVCRTDLHLVDGELPDPKLPLIPGHEIVGRVERLGGMAGTAAPELEIGQRVGIPWLGWTCGECEFCASDRENLCPSARFTGFQLDGGYAEYAVADARFVLPLPGSPAPASTGPASDASNAASLAPLLCAGLIGYRSLKFASDARRLGIYGFGAAAHLVAQVANWQGREVYAFTRPGDKGGQAFARETGAAWAGGSDETAPTALDAAIIFAPVGALVPKALAAVRPGGVVVCGGIHMSDIPSFPYTLLWGERVVRSVANLTRADAREFMEIAQRVPVHSTVTVYPLELANQALADLRDGSVQGAAVLEPRGLTAGT